jgi:L-rhamnose mutarotase
MIYNHNENIRLKTKDNKSVGYTAFHMKVHSDVFEFLEEAINKVNLSDKTDKVIKIQIDMGRVVGNTTCVSVLDNDTFRYAKRLGRNYPTRFVLNRKPVPCNFISVVLKSTPNGKRDYHLLTAYIGYMATKEVHDPKITLDEAHEANEYWSNHALIWDETILEKDA